MSQFAALFLADWRQYYRDRPTLIRRYIVIPFALPLLLLVIGTLLISMQKTQRDSERVEWSIALDDQLLPGLTAHLNQGLDIAQTVPVTASLELTNHQVVLTLHEAPEGFPEAQLERALSEYVTAYRKEAFQAKGHSHFNWLGAIRIESELPAQPKSSKPYATIALVYLMWPLLFGAGMAMTAAKCQQIWMAEQERGALEQYWLHGVSRERFVVAKQGFGLVLSLITIAVYATHYWFWMWLYSLLVTNVAPEINPSDSPAFVVELTHGFLAAWAQIDLVSLVINIISLASALTVYLAWMQLLLRRCQTQEQIRSKLVLLGVILPHLEIIAFATGIVEPNVWLTLIPIGNSFAALSTIMSDGNSSMWSVAAIAVNVVVCGLLVKTGCHDRCV
ncbi:hypothetical protein IC617_08135 [Neiella sp. HB171785]|uniref:ABC transporter permease n=1 Tax=Neiella litorisoli TaxID=2771431 RepID=A0A8J6QU27_9GAMM|nr:hypothetical protein [Neiella litorisoli]MBD1389392.1 hypothetical protein [Neiella litorisoli]